MNLLLSLLLYPIFNRIFRREFKKKVGGDFEADRFEVTNVYNTIGEVTKLRDQLSSANSRIDEL